MKDSIKITDSYTISDEPPDFKSFIDQDILDRFHKPSVFYGDIINAQLIREIRNLIRTVEKLRKDMK